MLISAEVRTHAPDPNRSIWRGIGWGAVSILPAATIWWGLSFPGFPVVGAGLLLINAVVLVALWTQSSFRWVIPATGIILAGGIFLASSLGHAPLHARWAASSAAFEAELADLGPPGRLAVTPDGAHFQDLPGPCPSRIGEFPIGECLAVDDGYLFLQSPGAVTDSSGFVYLPNGNRPESTGLSSDGLTALGGPWWAWTCDC